MLLCLSAAPASTALVKGLSTFNKITCFRVSELGYKDLFVAETLRSGALSQENGKNKLITKNIARQFHGNSAERSKPELSWNSTTLTQFCKVQIFVPFIQPSIGKI